MTSVTIHRIYIVDDTEIIISDAISIYHDIHNKIHINEVFAVINVDRSTIMPIYLYCNLEISILTSIPILKLLHNDI